MAANRRGFLKAAGITAAVSGILQLDPLAAFVEGSDRTNRINAPNGDRDYGSIDGGGIYTWSGVVRNVKFGSVNGNSTLDLSQLKAASITIGQIDGACGVLLNATGNVTIDGKIDGRSWVAVQAGGDITIHGKIDGRSRVRLKAKGNIRVDQKLDGGPCTMIVVSAEGNITLADQINGKTVYKEDDITEPFNMKSFPFDKRCDSDAKDYPTPPLP